MDEIIWMALCCRFCCKKWQHCCSVLQPVLQPVAAVVIVYALRRCMFLQWQLCTSTRHWAQMPPSPNNHSVSQQYLLFALWSLYISVCVWVVYFCNLGFCVSLFDVFCCWVLLSVPVQVTISEMTCNVSEGTLNLTHSLNRSYTLVFDRCFWFVYYEYAAKDVVFMHYWATLSARHSHGPQ